MLTGLHGVSKRGKGVDANTVQPTGLGIGGVRGLAVSESPRKGLNERTVSPGKAGSTGWGE